jgi:hypothetical protein
VFLVNYFFVGEMINRIRVFQSGGEAAALRLKKE